MPKVCCLHSALLKPRAARRPGLIEPLAETVTITRYLWVDMDTKEEMGAEILQNTGNERALLPWQRVAGGQRQSTAITGLMVENRPCMLSGLRFERWRTHRSNPVPIPGLR